jgi:hypothetical protein
MPHYHVTSDFKDVYGFEGFSSVIDNFIMNISNLMIMIGMC